MHVQSSFSSDYPVRYTFKTNVNFENCLFQIMYYYYTVNELRQKTYFFLVTRSLQIVLFKQQKIYSYILILCTSGAGEPDRLAISRSFSIVLTTITTYTNVPLKGQPRKQWRQFRGVLGLFYRVSLARDSLKGTGSHTVGHNGGGLELL